MRSLPKLLLVIPNWMREYCREHTRLVSLKAHQAKRGVHLIDTSRVCCSVSEHRIFSSCLYHTWHPHKFKIRKMYSILWWCFVLISKFGIISSVLSCAFMKLEETSHYGGLISWSRCYGCTIVMSYIGIKCCVTMAVSLSSPFNCAFLLFHLLPVRFISVTNLLRFVRFYRIKVPIDIHFHC